VAIDRFRRFFNFLANMGLIVRDDPPKTIDMTGRAWGEAWSGLALSIREIRKEDPGQLAAISVVMRNAGGDPKRFSVPGWLFFYEVNVVGPDGCVVPLTGYGRELTKPERRAETVELSLAPGDATETDLPVATLYDMRRPGEYRVLVSCLLPDGALVQSNEIVIRS